MSHLTPWIIRRLSHHQIQAIDAPQICFGTRFPLFLLWVRTPFFPNEALLPPSWQSVSITFISIYHSSFRELIIRWSSRGLSQPDRGTSWSASQKFFSFLHDFLFSCCVYILPLWVLSLARLRARVNVLRVVIQSVQISVQWIPCIVREAPVIPNFLELWLYELPGGGGDATYVLFVTCFPFPEADHVLLAHSYPVQSRWVSIINTVQCQLLYSVSEDALRCGVLIMVPRFGKSLFAGA